MISIKSSAKEDLRRGYRFYEKQREGLGSYFIDSLFADIDSLLIYAGIHPVVQGYHRLLARRFPYAIYYRIFTSEICVVAILDCRKNPEFQKRRLPESV